MIRYTLVRLLRLIPVIFGVTIMVYALMYISPGDPAQKRLLAQGISVDEEVLEQAREEMGLNRPFAEQYADWATGMLKGDFGLSFKDDMPVAGKLAKGIKNTLALALPVLGFSLLISFPLGIFTAVHANGPADTVIRFLTFAGISLPNFLISILLMYFLCLRLGLLPVIAKGSFTGLLLPALALSIPMISRFARQFRAHILEELHKPYVTGLLARGAKTRTVLWRNVLRSALGPILTTVGLSFGMLMSGSVVGETIFRWPGIGKLVMDSITARDYPTIQGFVIIIAAIYVLIDLLTDISYHLLDPRLSGKG